MVLSQNMFCVKALQKWFLEAKEENRQASLIHQHADEYIQEQIKKAEAVQQHALARLSKELGEATEKNKLFYQKHLELCEKEKEDQAKLHVAEEARVVEEARVEVAESSASELEREVEFLKKGLEESAAFHLIELERISAMKFEEGENLMKSKVEGAWELGPHQLAPFRYFEKRIDYQNKLLEAQAAGNPPPSPFHDDEVYPSPDDEEEEEEEEEVEEEEEEAAGGAVEEDTVQGGGDDE